jgi:hypothetical protein
MPLMNIASRQLLIWPIMIHGFVATAFLKSGYGAELFWTAWTLERHLSFRGPKMSGSG